MNKKKPIATHHQQNAMTQRTVTKKSERGLFFGLIIALVTVIASVLIAVFGNSTAASIVAGVIGGGGLVSLTSVFVYGKRETQKERERRRQEVSH